MVLQFSLFLFFLPSLTTAISSCGGTCQTLNDCAGQLICISGKCNDDPTVGTHVCSNASSTTAISSSCGGTCQTLNDCAGQLICISGKCNDDPTLGTHICSDASSTSGGCNQAGTLTCGGKSYYTYDCSPPITSSTPAFLSNNDFTKADNSGGGPSECDGRYHENTELIVALSTGWYDKGNRCGNLIRITAKNGRKVNAKVVDECDSLHGYSCDSERDVEGPCANNIINGSDAVWEALGLNSTIEGIAEVTWTMAERVRSYLCIVSN